MKKFIIIAPLLLLLLTGCTEERREIRKKAIDACIKQGGIPILLDSDAYNLQECQFKETN